ncbi:hypothetical protein [Natronoglycomyces albus]|uniref:Uncharacterized protein n=1 Tax=Natronoglycomyces albus TaxID=2811108 RepID=A0A895XUI0_9ACTN|nr:hypothetical protein [Natronoglycomyces albus]QSB07133.1 hypothetical protein JQS30_16865 [Natronoglycomyces albus]
MNDQTSQPRPTAEELRERVYAECRTFTDGQLAQLRLSAMAAGVADRASILIEAQSDPLEAVEAAAHLVQEAQETLRAAVLAARLRGCSWESIGETITGETGKRQTMINRYGTDEQTWKEVLLEPVAEDERGRAHLRPMEGLCMEDLTATTGYLATAAARHTTTPPQLPPATAAARVADYTWRLSAAITRYGATNIPPSLSADLEKRKTVALGNEGQENSADEGQEQGQAAEAAAVEAVDPSGALEQRLRDAYAALAREPGAWVPLAQVREHLAADRDEVDAALRTLFRARAIDLIPEVNQKTLTPEDRAAAINLGAEDKHLIAIHTNRS